MRQCESTKKYTAAATVDPLMKYFQVRKCTIRNVFTHNSQMRPETKNSIWIQIVLFESKTKIE